MKAIKRVGNAPCVVLGRMTSAAKGALVAAIQPIGDRRLTTITRGRCMDARREADAWSALGRAWQLPLDAMPDLHTGEMEPCALADPSPTCPVVAEPVVAFPEGGGNDPSTFAGSLPMGDHPVDAAALLYEVCQLLEASARSCGIRINTLAPPRGWGVVGDRTTLRDALVHVGENAIAACPINGQIRLSLMHVSLDKTEIIVVNSGPPLGAVACAQAMTPFGDPCASGRTGTGRTLPTIQNNIRRLGGEIAIRGDILLGGTVTTLTLPTASLPSAGPPRRKPKASPATRHPETALQHRHASNRRADRDLVEQLRLARRPSGTLG